MEKISTSIKIFFNLRSLCTVICDFDIMYYFTFPYLAKYNIAKQLLKGFILLSQQSCFTLSNVNIGTVAPPQKTRVVTEMRHVVVKNI